MIDETCPGFCGSPWDSHTKEEKHACRLKRINLIQKRFDGADSRDDVQWLLSEVVRLTTIDVHYIERLKQAAINHAKSLQLMRQQLRIPEELQETASELGAAAVAFAKVVEL